jgi:hypothetical protein
MNVMRMVRKMRMMRRIEVNENDSMPFSYLLQNDDLNDFW